MCTSTAWWRSKLLNIGTPCDGARLLGEQFIAALRVTLIEAGATVRRCGRSWSCQRCACVCDLRYAGCRPPKSRVDALSPGCSSPTVPKWPRPCPGPLRTLDRGWLVSGRLPGYPISDAYDRASYGELQRALAHTSVVRTRLVVSRVYPYHWPGIPIVTGRQSSGAAELTQGPRRSPLFMVCRELPPCVRARGMHGCPVQQGGSLVDVGGVGRVGRAVQDAAHCARRDGQGRQGPCCDRYLSAPSVCWACPHEAIVA
jgi:hypothetical protein